MSFLAYRPGDVLRRTDRFGLDHDAVADADGGVIRQVMGRGVVRERMAEFDPLGLAKVVEMPGRRFDRDETLARAHGALGTPGYNLLTENCQHFVAWCATGERRSHQIDGVVTVATIAAGVATLVRLATPIGLAVTAGATLAYLARNAVAAHLRGDEASAGVSASPSTRP